MNQMTTKTVTILLKDLGLTLADLEAARLPEHSDELDLICMIACRSVPVMPKYCFATVAEAVAALLAHKQYHGKLSLVANGRTDTALNLYKLTSTKLDSYVHSMWS